MASWCLLVEDDASLRALAVELLERLGYHTLAASDARAALELLIDTPGVDLLLADMVLPNGMNGAELARRAQGVRPRYRCCSCRATRRTRSFITAGWMKAFSLLEKPFTLNALAVAVRQALDSAAR